MSYKTIIFFYIICFLSYNYLFSEVIIETFEHDGNLLEINSETVVDTENTLDSIDIDTLQTKFLITDEIIQFIDLQNYSGLEDSDTITLDKHRQCLLQLEQGEIFNTSTTDSIKPFSNFNKEMDNLFTPSSEKSTSEFDCPMEITFYDVYIVGIGYLVYFTSLPLKETVYRGSNITFNFSNLKLLPFYNKTIESIEVDFGDGIGYRNIEGNLNGSFNFDVSIQYWNTGKKNIKTRLIVEGREYFSHSTITVESMTIPEPTIILNLVGDIPYYDKYATGQAYIYLSEKNDTVKNPIIFVEGFDLDNSMNADELFHFLMQENLNNLLSDLGFDVIILNFSNATDYIQRNSFLLVDLINRINSIKQSNNEIIVIGASMGGLVSRYALNYMEENSIDHKTRLFVSFDSPQKGANIPLGLQYWLRFFSSYNSTANYYKNKLLSPAAQQMLLDHFASFPYTNFLRENFLNEIGDNYPNRLRNVAIANGAATGTALDFGIGSKILDYSYSSWKVDILGNCWSAGGGASSIKCFHGIVDKLGPSYREQKIKIKIPDRDFLPGGLRNTQKQISDTDVDYGNITTSIPNHCFIPTISSLGINTNDPYHPINEDSNIYTITPFDSIYYPITNENQSQEHVLITSEIVNWIIEEIIPTHIILEDAKVWGEGEIKAKHTIRLMPGYHVMNPANYVIFK